VSNGEINRELTTLKRMYSLAMQQTPPKILHKPKIVLLPEDASVRQGFFDAAQIASVRAHLPEALQPVITFAFVTAWRITSEVLPLQWRQVDFASGEIRLHKGETKNRDGRVFKMTAELRTLLEHQHAEHKALTKAGKVCPYVFFRMVAKGRGGEKSPRPILTLTKAWAAACRAAGCPGRIPHDLRRSAIRNMVRAGITETVAMKLSGHRTRSVFDRYNIVSDRDLGDAATKLDALSANHSANHWGRVQAVSGEPRRRKR
ncbi:MAG TPA: tyrosine-type recombinase/integrase, partial [Vicinamibacterales bacterium]|nr:tyrosine-type recombinase/integrase [Vicinamibacterales bacterium]